jgi:hypothetical protein
LRSFNSEVIVFRLSCMPLMACKRASGGVEDRVVGVIVLSSFRSLKWWTKSLIL